MVGWRDLTAATAWLLDDVGHPQIRCLPLTPGQATYLDGRTDGRTLIQYARRAPLHVVAHEVAHCLVGVDAGHTEPWFAAFVDCCRRLCNAPT